MKANLLRAPEPPAPSFRNFLQAELASRCSRNPQYSLRAFARHLELDHATLSQLLRGRRRLTPRTIRRIGVRLGLEESAVAEHLSREEICAGAAARSDATLREARELARDTATLISDGHHYAILELVRLECFRPDVRWISRVLGTSTDDVNIALQRLLRLGLLEMVAPDRWIDRSGDTTASLEGFTQAAFRRLFEELQSRALRAAREAAPDRWEYSSTTVAVSSARVAVVVERLGRLRGEVLALLESPAPRDDVYRLEIGFFPVTNLQREETDRGPTRNQLADRDEGA